MTSFSGMPHILIEGFTLVVLKTGCFQGRTEDLAVRLCMVP